MNLNKYYLYLRRRSRLGYLYRNFYLYPTISRFASGRILDVGCGVGDFLRFYENSVGVDINPETVAYCLSRGLAAVQMRHNEIPFNDSCFDSVVLDNVLEHIEDPTLLLREINRVLIREGTLIVGVPGERGFKYDKDHKVYYDQEGLVDVICNSKFVHKFTLKLPFGFPYAGKLLRQYCLYGVFEKVG